MGSGTALWRFEDELVAGRMTEEECFVAEGCMARSAGHCMTMGTASTMASWPRRSACSCRAQRPGRPWTRAVRDSPGGRAADRGLVEEDLRPSAIMTREAFENAIRVNAAIGGSTNAVIHLLAIAGRLGVPLPG